MNNSQSWINNVQKQVKDKSSWSFTAQDNAGKIITLKWHMTNILSPELATFKKEVADMAARITAAFEIEFLHRYPEAVDQEIFLKPCISLFAQGVNNVDWNAVEKIIQTTIKQFYCADIKTFGDQMLKILSSDIYFLARATDKETDSLVGFCMLAVTPYLAYGDIKLINIIAESGQCQQYIEKLLFESLFSIINPLRVFTAIRSANVQARTMFESLGFTIDSNPKQDPNHKLNLNYFSIMEYIR